MSQNIVYLITGANRGIGLGLTASLLLRPNTTVVATVRSETTPTDDLKRLPTAAGSRLLILPLSSTSDTAAAALAASLPAHDITHLDTVVANAGTGNAFEPCVSAPLDTLRQCFEINTLGPVKLFQATHALLQGSQAPKFVVISSVLGSLGAMEALPCLAYGASKAAANYLVRKAHIENAEIATLAVHPGWVQTDMGQGLADAIGMKEPPVTLEKSVKGVLAQIDGAEKMSGSFVSYDGTIVPW